MLWRRLRRRVATGYRPGHVLKARATVAIRRPQAAAAVARFDELTPRLTLIGPLVLAIIAAETAETRQLRQASLR